MPHSLDEALKPFVGRILETIGVPFAGTTQYSTLSDFLWASDQDAEIADDVEALIALCDRIQTLGVEAKPEDCIWDLAERLRQRDHAFRT